MHACLSPPFTWIAEGRGLLCGEEGEVEGPVPVEHRVGAAELMTTPGRQTASRRRNEVGGMHPRQAGATR